MDFSALTTRIASAASLTDELIRYLCAGIVFLGIAALSRDSLILGLLSSEFLGYNTKIASLLVCGLVLGVILSAVGEGLVTLVLRLAALASGWVGASGAVLAPKELEHNLLFHIYDEIQRACGKDILAGVTDRKGLGTTVLNICLKYYATMYRDLELGWREHLRQRSVLEAVSAALLLGSLLRVGPLRPWLFAFGLGVLALAVAEARKGSRVGIRIVVAGFLRQKMAQGAPKE